MFFCFQCAGQASTNLPTATWSVQSVRLIACPTMRGRWTVAVRKITFELRETLPPWHVHVSVCSHSFQHKKMSGYYKL